MKIGFIGAGKVGKSLGKYLSNHGLHISGYFSPLSAAFAASQTYSLVFTSLGTLLDNSDLIVITTPDDIIPSIVAKLKDCKPINKHICHMSGSISSEILSPLRSENCNVFSLHPIMTVNENTDYADVLFTVEGDAQILQELPIKYLEISPSQKPLYHAALCMSSNYITTLLSMAQQLLDQIGLDAGISQPLAEEAIKNFYKTGKESLTGPIARGDIKTIMNHLDNIKDPKVALIYKALGLQTIDIAKNDLKKEQIDTMTEVLSI